MSWFQHFPTVTKLYRLFTGCTSNHGCSLAAVHQFKVCLLQYGLVLLIQQWQSRI